MFAISFDRCPLPLVSPKKREMLLLELGMFLDGEELEEVCCKDDGIVTVTRCWARFASGDESGPAYERLLVSLKVQAGFEQLCTSNWESSIGLDGSS